MNKELILITGGSSGMLAHELSVTLSEKYRLRFLTRTPKASNEYRWDIDAKYIDTKAFDGIQHVFHIAGESIGGKRWSKAQKKKIISSRVDSANLLLTKMIETGVLLKTFISVSATGYYGMGTSQIIFDENHSQGKGFLSDVCQCWEDASQQFAQKNIAQRVVVLRLGVILSRKLGAFSKIAFPIKNGFGAFLGTGKQYFPWIHIVDVVRMFKYVLQNKQIQGVFNAVAPEHITNASLTKIIAGKYGRKIILPNIPKSLLKLVFGEMSAILLEGSRVSSKKIVDAGFEFKYPDFQLAVENVI